MSDAEKLLDMKKQLEKAKSIADTSKGKYEAAMDRLKKEFKFSNLKEAEKASDEMEILVEKIGQEIREEIKELEDTYDWN